MLRQEQLSLMFSGALSLAIHATAVVYFEPFSATEPAATQPAPTLLLSMAAPRPAPPQAAPEPVPEPEPAPPPEIQPPPTPVPVPAPKPVAKPKPRPQPVLRKSPPTEIAETAPPEPIQVVAATLSVADKPALAQEPRVSERESYLARLLAHIDSHKFYPRSARRRGVTGEVRVSFFLLGDGAIRDLRITGGSKVLRQAAREAIRNALTLPQPPDTLGLQQPIRFAMEYRLDS